MATDGHSACKLCGGARNPLREVLIQRKHKVEMLQCDQCGSISYGDPFWIAESCANPVSELDTGLAQRGQLLANLITGLLLVTRTGVQHGLDYGGGIGLLARLLRDRGFDWYSVDPFCQLLFPMPEWSSEWPGPRLVSLIEVFEHLGDPVQEFDRFLPTAEMVVLSTTLCSADGEADDWWYFQFETGAHINIATRSGLKCFADRLGFYLASGSEFFHVLTRNKLRWHVRFMIAHPWILAMIGYLAGPLLQHTRSLIEKDAGYRE